MAQQITLTGVISTVRFSNPDTGFVVLSFEPDDQTPPFVAIGKLPGAASGMPLKLIGHWEKNKNFGMQFRFEAATPMRPDSKRAIAKYLGSGMIHGIGKVMAKRIVDQFGEKTLDVMDKDINQLGKVPGIGKVSLKKIKEAWTKQQGQRALALFCHEYGLPPSFVPKLIDAYGFLAENTLRQNPYQIALDIKGAGFVTADAFAQRLGVHKDHPGRALAGLIHVLESAGSEGNVALPERLLIERASRLLDQSPESLTDDIENAIDEKILVREKDLSLESLIYTKPAIRIEKDLAQSLQRLTKGHSTVRKFKKAEALSWVEKRLGIELADQQKQGVIGAIENKVMVITGGPGTGKTTIIQAILEILDALKQSVALAAPTGRAAKRMTEATGRQAMTIHRLLKYTPQKRGFEYDEKNPLPCNALIVDEASMLDQWLAEKLVSALSANAKLILVGDVDQLPSVGPGNVLSDVIASELFPYVRLTEIFRQDSTGLIVPNAHLINQGKRPTLPEKGEISDFYFLYEEDPAALRDLICDLAVKRLPKRFGLDPINEIQVISPMHRGEAGVESLNQQLQQCLNPQGETLGRLGFFFRIGDKVMQTVNDYDKEVFNGDTGRIVSIESGEMNVKFDQGIRRFTGEDLNNLVLAYAVSVHKSQGSEYPAVIVPLSTQHFILLQRNLLYTAVTRAKKLVVLAGSYKALGQALKNDRPAHRYTALAERLKTMTF